GEWDPTNLRRAFWLWNIGLAWMVLAGDVPVGLLQLETAFTQGYDAARSLAFYNRGLVQRLFWLRLPGDLLLILGTGLFCYDVLKKRSVKRAETEGVADGTPVSRRLFDSTDGKERDPSDD
ncbi:MAG: cytochrome B, partial [Haloarculaceae archaeon]